MAACRQSISAMSDQCCHSLSQQYQEFKAGLSKVMKLRARRSGTLIRRQMHLMSAEK